MHRLTKLAGSAVVMLGLAVAAMMVAAPSARAHSWVQLHPTGTLPTPREEATAVHDPASNRLILFGGMGPFCCFKRSDVWILTNADGSGPGTPTWLEVTPATSISRTNHSAFYSTTTNRMIVFGGEDNVSGRLLNEVWLLDNANGLSGTPAWRKLTTAGTPPVPRAGQAAVYDELSNRLILFGGFYIPGTPWAPIDDTWVLSNADGSAAGQSLWTQIATTGTKPAARVWAATAYDAATNQMLLFGGSDFAARSKSFNDVWVLSNANGLGAGPSQWSQRAPAGTPPAVRHSPASAYNPVSGRLVLFGGTDDRKAYNDNWVLKNAFAANPQWVKRSPLGVAMPTLSQTGNVYVPATDRLIVSSGDQAPACCSYTNKTYVMRWAAR